MVVGQKILRMALLSVLVMLPSILAAGAETRTMGIVQSGRPVLRDLAPFMDGLMEAQLDANHIPGGVVSVTVGDEIVFLKGYGFADIDRRVAVDAEKTLFRIASVSKLFGWMSVMQLAERGRVDLDEDINAYLDFEIPETFPQPITLRHLLTHTAGFEDFNIGTDARTEADRIALGESLKRSIPKRVHPPGERSGYSNYGAALAGYIVERIAGLPFYQYVEENVFAPLNMARSTFRQPLPDALVNDLALGYGYDNGEFRAGEFSLMVRYPDGAASSTAKDMAQFAIAHLNGAFGTPSVLEPRSFEAMHKRQFGNIPQVSGMTLGFEEKMYNGRRMIGHGGDITNYRAKLVLLPEEKVSIFLAFNGDETGSARGQIIQRFMDRYFPDPSASDLFSAEPLADATDDVEGFYVSSRRNYTTIEKIYWPIAIGVSVNRLTEAKIGVDFYGQTHIFERVSTGIYRVPDSERMSVTDIGSVLVTKDPETGWRNLYFSQFGSFYFEQAPWYENLQTHLRLLLLSIALAAAGAVAIIFWRRPERLVPSGSVRLLGIVSVLSTICLVGFVFVAATLINEDLIYGIAARTRAAFAIPLIGAGLSIMALVLLAVAVKRNQGSAGLKVGVALNLCASAILLWQFGVWNMVGLGGVP